MSFNNAFAEEGVPTGTMNFFDDNVLLSGKTAMELYNGVKNLPIIDYHCHLNDAEITADKKFDNIGQLWLSTDHYKWRAMRLCGVDEKYITGDAPIKEKFLKYAEIMPKLIGNPLYYFSHLELKTAFGINEPLNPQTAQSIWDKANEKLKTLSVRKLLELYNVEYIATTDDPATELNNHKKYGGTTLSPTFRPDKIFELNEDYFISLSKVSGIKVDSLKTLKAALTERLDFFISKKCVISDHGFDFAPGYAVSEDEAAQIFENRTAVKTEEEKHRFFCYMLEWLASEYSKRNIVMQLHFGTMRNINTVSLNKIGKDAGFDVFRSYVDTDAIARFLDRLNSRGELPKTILYSHNKNYTPALCSISGGFDNVRVGAAWWLNDTLKGIRQHLSELSEYATLGTFLGMLTDSRSYLSYARFDFFRRILASFVANFVDNGEYDENFAHVLMKDICYNNIKSFLNI